MRTRSAGRGRGARGDGRRAPRARRAARRTGRGHRRRGRGSARRRRGRGAPAAASAGGARSRRPRAPGARARPSCGASSARRRSRSPRVRERRRRGDAEEEVPGHAIAHRAGEDHRHHGLVARAAAASARGTAAAAAEPDEREDVRARAVNAGSHDRRGDAAEPRLPACPLDRDDGLQQHPDGLRRELRLLARVLAPEVDRLVLVEAHLRALVDRRRPCPSARVRSAATLGPRRGAREVRDLVDPVAATRGRS